MVFPAQISGESDRRSELAASDPAAWALMLALAELALGSFTPYPRRPFPVLRGLGQWLAALFLRAPNLTRGFQDCELLRGGLEGLAPTLQDSLSRFFSTASTASP